MMVNAASPKTNPTCKASINVMNLRIGSLLARKLATRIVLRSSLIVLENIGLLFYLYQVGSFLCECHILHSSGR